MIPEYHRIVLLSDLHLTPAERLGNFAAGPALAEFTRIQAEAARRGEALVLAGDIFDFLLIEDRPLSLHLATAARLAGELMRRLRSETDWMEPWLAALRQWIDRGGQVVLLPGNHDLEWFHPDTDKVWRDALGEADGFSIWRDAEPWRAGSGAWEVIVGHGHRGDPLNDCDPRRIHAALTRGEDSIPLPPGSQFVLTTLHAFKRAMDPRTGRRRFPFLDALKPEYATLALLWALDPPLFRRHLPAGFRLIQAEILRSLLRRLQPPTVLGAQEPSGPAPEPRSTGSDSGGREVEQGFEQAMAGLIADGLPDGVTKAVLEAEMSALFRGDEPALHGTLAAAAGSIGRARRWMFRGWLRQVRKSVAAFFNPTELSAADRAVVDAWLPESLPRETQRVVVCGHTHAARSWAREDTPHHYLNTGTWTNLLQLDPADESDAAIDALWKSFEGGHLPFHWRLTWAEITPQGPVLRDAPGAIAPPAPT
ncbi:MAG: metallophosphoesterase [Verrucomicrobiae bacterium]|nr:metallophosphoesterase [Verrucomicrobiae bacterium]